MNKILLLLLIIPLTSASQIINKTMYFDGLDREYIIYIPLSYDGSQDVPLLFSFHGGSGYANDFMQMIKMNDISDTAGFIAVYPQGALDIDGADGDNPPSTSWLHKAPTDHNDVNFIAAIIDSLSSEYSVDENRVYACGYSEGGIFSYELGCRLNNRIAAFASVSGSMLTESFRLDYGFGNCSPVHSTGVMLIPGTNDGSFHALYDGFQPYYMSSSEITSYWSIFNSTDVEPLTSIISDNAPNDGSNVERREWLNGDNCVSVVELKVVGGGHDWPGSFGNMDINASEEIWRFVSKYNINGLIDCSTALNSNFIIEKNKRVVKIVDVFGRESNNLKKQPLFYIYDNGTVEKRMIIE